MKENYELIISTFFLALLIFNIIRAQKGNIKDYFSTLSRKFPIWIQALLDTSFQLLIKATFDSYKVFAIFSYYKTKIQKIFLRGVILRLSLWLFLYYLLFVYSPKVKWLEVHNITIFDGLIEDFKISSITGNSSIDFITFFMKVIQILLPLAISLYIFTYREQKAVSETSSFLSSKGPIILFIEVGIFTIIFGYHVMYVLKNKGAPESVHILIAFCLIIATFFFAYRTVVTLLKNININWLLKDTLKQLDKFLERVAISSIPKAKIRQQMYVDITSKIESIYQMLSLTIDKNMDSVYEKSYDKINKIIVEFQNHLHVLDDIGNAVDMVRYTSPLKKVST
jgi:hypothetical protein